MAIFFLAADGGFYDDRAHSIPERAVSVSMNEYKALLAGEAAGQILSHDLEGRPILIDPHPLGVEETAKVERAWRDSEVERVKWLRERHRDEIDLGKSPTLTAARFSEILIYLQELRDWPQSVDFPNSAHRPTVPAWISDES